MRQLGDAEYLARALERAYQFRDVFNEMWREQQEAGVTVEDRVAASSVRESLNNMVAYYNRELRIIARRGGHGHRVAGAASGCAGARSSNAQSAA